MKNLFTYHKFSRIPVVYKLITVHNNLFYIGSTHDMYKRMKDHRNDLKGNRHCSSHMQNVYNKYQCVVLVEILETFTPGIGRMEILQREEYYINRFNPKYNTVKTPTKRFHTGTTKTVHQYDLEGNFIKTWNSVREIIRTIRVQVSPALNKINRSTGGYQWTTTKVTNLGQYKANQGVLQPLKVILTDGTVTNYPSVDDCILDMFSNMTKKSARHLIYRIMNGQESKYVFEKLIGPVEVKPSTESTLIAGTPLSSDNYNIESNLKCDSSKISEIGQSAAELPFKGRRFND